MPYMRKAEAERLSAYLTKTLTKILGAPTVREHSDTLTWSFAYDGNGATVTIQLMGFMKAGNKYFAPWLACRLSNPAHLDADGYVKPRGKLNWPSAFTYPSGKCNLHFDETGNAADHARDLAGHLYRMTCAETPKRHALGSVEFETIDA